MLKDNFFKELTTNLTQMEKTASAPEVTIIDAPQTQTKDQAPQTSKMAQMLKELVKIAEELDRNGSTKAADLIDQAIEIVISKT